MGCTIMVALLENEAAVIKNPEDWLPWIYQDTIRQNQATDAMKVTSLPEFPDSG